MIDSRVLWIETISHVLEVFLCSLGRSIFRHGNWCRISLTDGHAKFLLKTFWHVPGVVDVIIWNIVEFRAPKADELAFGVKLLTLCHSVEEVGATGPYTRGEVPTGVV